MPETIVVNHTHVYAEVCTSACPANPWFEKQDLGDALLSLATDWRASDDETVRACANQLQQVIDANGPGL